MRDVTPEIEKLRKRVIGPLEVGAAVLLSDAEAAVLACEERVRGRRGDGTWPDQSAQHAVLLDQIKTARADTVAEIVEALRAEFQRFSEDSMATDYDLAMRDGWIYAADLIEECFGGGGCPCCGADS